MKNIYEKKRRKNDGWIRNTVDDSFKIKTWEKYLKGKLFFLGKIKQKKNLHKKKIK